jgi:hypothetical protein
MSRARSAIRSSCRSSSPPPHQEFRAVGGMQMTTNRREMLCRAAGALTAVAFSGCGVVSSALAQEPQRRREVVVNGSRVRTVDMHAHCHIPEANALMGLKVQLPSLVISPERTKVMDEQASTSRRSASTQSFGPRPTPTSPVRSSSCKTRNSPRFARHSRRGSSGWPQ